MDEFKQLCNQESEVKAGRTFQWKKQMEISSTDISADNIQLYYSDKIISPREQMCPPPVQFHCFFIIKY